MAWSLYNKYRPSTFSEVVGQEHVEKTLMNAVVTGTASHAYLFAGPRGTGKTTTARLLAKALLCDLAPTDNPDGDCAQCVQIADGAHPDVYELDAASRTGVDNVREEIIGRVHFAPTRGAWKIYIIDEVHMLTTQAFNALLKTLEEPPAQVLFVLCTTDAHKVPATIQSRCQRFDFRRLRVEQITAHLAWICEQEGYTAEERALELIAQRSQGGMRDAISSLEQVAVYSGGQINFAAAESMIGEVTDDQLFALVDTLVQGDVAGSFSWIADFVLGGTDIALLVSDMAKHVRCLYLTALTNDDARLAEILATGADELARYRAQAAAFASPERLAYILTVLGDLTTELKSAPNARLALEIACTRIIRPEGGQTIEALAARIAKLERAIADMPVSITAPSDSLNNPARATNEPLSSPGGALKVDALKVDAAEVGTLSTTESNAVAPSVAKRAITNSTETPVPSTREHNNIASIWPRVTEEIKQASRSVATRLDGSQARLEGNVVIVELPAGADFTKRNLEAADNFNLVRTKLAKISGVEYELRYAVAREPVLAPAVPASATPAPDPAIPATPAPASHTPTYAPITITEPKQTYTPTEPTLPTPAPLESMADAPLPPSGRMPSSDTPEFLQKEDIAAMLSASLGAEVSLNEIEAE